MKSGATISAVFLGLLALRVYSQPVTATVATNTTAVRLTIELRDGSRVVGDALDQTWPFHSDLLGNLQLAVPALRTLDCVKTNAATLTTVSGDELAVTFTCPELKVKTGFGPVALPVASIRRLSVTAARFAGRPTDGLVALWSAEGNADDRVGQRPGQLINQAGFAPGQIGQAFVFHTLGDGVTAPATDLPAGTSDRTLACWVYIEAYVPDETFIAGYGNTGVDGQFYDLAVLPDHRVVFSQWGETVAGPVLDTGRWYHLAVTSIGHTSVKLYVDGVNVAKGALDFDTPTGGRFYIGSLQASFVVRQFIGLIDEVAVYNRALADDEIQALYAGGVSAPVSAH